MMKKQLYQTKINSIAVAFLISFFPGLAQAQQLEETGRVEGQKPYNLVVIMTDNHGPWTLGCYGNQEVLTPNIDQLASQGMLFERAFASNPVCSPTRATFLTGLMPSQHGVHSWLHADRLQMGPDAQSTLTEFTSLGDVLRAAGYACGLVGKWHLGDNMRPQEGFDSYWITKPHGNTLEFYDQPIIYEGKVYTEPRYTTDLWTEHAIKFLRQNQGKEKPFFLLLTYNGPYGLGPSLLQPAQNRHAKYYADKQLASFPRNPIHPWQYNNREYMNNPTSMRRYAAEISGVDDGVGRVLDAIRQLGLDEQTLIVFTADQGLGCGQHGLWGMGDHTKPLHAFDPTMHIPLIFRHQGLISAGSNTKMMVANYDMMPTILGYLGMDGKKPTEPSSPGRDFSSTLRGQSIQWNNVMFYEYINTRAIRTDQWKLILRQDANPNELYNLTKDPGEWINLYDNKTYAQIQSELTKQLTGFFDRYADSKYDLWDGGHSKTLLDLVVVKKPN
ncbi:MAG: sulfatase-like hydrolase/transferase [Bacteroidota bacterium]